jgi:DNA-binding NtrC family response regulator
MRYDWPGNVRELRHFIEKTLLVTSKRVLGREDLLLEQHFLSSATSSGESAGAPRNDEAFSGADFSWSSATLRSAREAVEKEFLRRKLDANQGKVSAAARDAGVSRETFYRLLRKYGLDAAASK